MANNEELDQTQEFIQVKTEVHSLTKAFYSFVEEFKTYRDRSEPKPMSIGQIVAIFAGALSILGLLFGSVIYIASSQNAPMISRIQSMDETRNAQNAQFLATITAINNAVQQNTSLIQITNKDLSSVKSRAESNEQTIEWMLFSENLPKQITELRGDVDALIQKAHLHTGMAGVIKP